MMANNHCKECGCNCSRCVSNDHDVHLHVEIENLKQRLVERDNHIVTMETNFLNEANKFPNGELGALREELLTWQDKYKRLYEAHRRVQRVNQGLEDKLLKLVDVCETEKNALTKDVATLSRKLADANYTIKKLTEDNERYKSDVALAIQFLQCKQTNYVSQKFDTLPNEVQAQVSTYMSSSRRKQPDERRPSTEAKSIKVPMPTFPPTAMVYSVPKSPNLDRKADGGDCESASVDIVSAAIMAKVLEERERERSLVKHCDTCTCSKSCIKIIHNATVYHAIGTQTGEYASSLCLRCNSGLQQQQSPSSAMKIVKNPEAVKMKSVSVYTHDCGGDAHLFNNVAKVQPNNFLINSCSGESSNQTSPINVAGAGVGAGSEIITYQGDGENVCKDLAAQENPAVTEKTDAGGGVEEKSAKRGPRYCSMRLQSGSNNILLDNAHNDIAPVLYTRQGVKTTKPPKNSRSEGSCSSDELKAESVASSENSFQNHQRVAAWIRNNMDVVDLSGSETSRSNSIKNEGYRIGAPPPHAPDFDRKKYAEMENNVKKFLFGESEFLKTVEKGRLKYQDLSNCGSCVVKANGKSSRSNSHTETEI